MFFAVNNALFRGGSAGGGSAKTDLLPATCPVLDSGIALEGELLVEDSTASFLGIGLAPDRDAGEDGADTRAGDDVLAAKPRGPALRGSGGDGVIGLAFMLAGINGLIRREDALGGILITHDCKRGV